VGALLALGSAAGTSLKAIFVKLAYQHGVAATTLLAQRLLFTLPVFLVVIAVTTDRQARPLSRREWLSLVAVGLLGYYGAAILDFQGLRFITAGLERLILFTYPALTFLVALVMLGRRPHRLELVALVLSFGGMVLAFTHDLQPGRDLPAVVTGSLLVLGASLCFAFYLVGSAPLISRLGAARFTALAMVVSTFAVLLHFAATEPLVTLWRQPWQVHALAAAMALISTALPVFMQSSAIRRLGPGQAALWGTVGPVLTLLLGWWLLGEALSAAQLGGMALVVAGVTVVSQIKYTAGA
jgi:drug/metabolite transporter (DMT)-like permease